MSFPSRAIPNTIRLTASCAYTEVVRAATMEALAEGLPQSDCYVNVLRDAMSVDALDPCGVYFGTTGGQVDPDRPTEATAGRRSCGTLPAVLSGGGPDARELRPRQHRGRTVKAQRPERRRSSAEGHTSTGFVSCFRSTCRRWRVPEAKSRWRSTVRRRSAPLLDALEEQLSRSCAAPFAITPRRKRRAFVRFLRLRRGSCPTRRPDAPLPQAVAVRRRAVPHRRRPGGRLERALHTAGPQRHQTRTCPIAKPRRRPLRSDRTCPIPESQSPIRLTGMCCRCIVGQLLAGGRTV